MTLIGAPNGFNGDLSGFHVATLDYDAEVIFENSRMFIERNTR
jgi:hypothetical protein